VSQLKFRYFTILGSMRSGSNLLEQSLNQFDDIICHGELFNPAFIGGPKNKTTFGFSLAEREKTPLALIDAMVVDSGANIPGFRLFDGHDERVIQKTLADPKCAKIILQRTPLESYISLKIARKTDQWLLRDAPQRKAAQIYFDADEFTKYQNAHRIFHDNIRINLQKTGQTAFWLRYPEQKGLDILNGIAAFLGNKTPLKSVKENIRKQNPESLLEKVENFEEMQDFLAKTQQNTTPEAGLTPTMRANIPRMISCIGNPILFAPIPGGPNAEVLRWMHMLDAGADISTSYQEATKSGEILHTGHSQRTLFEWMNANPSVITITAVRHPIARAYGAFMSKIFPIGPNTYDMIRGQLIENFKISLPDAKLMKNCDQKTLKAAGYGIKEHRAAFHGFLRFLNANLSRQTSIRVDGLWAHQTQFLAGFNSTLPIALITREGALDAGFRYVESLLDLPTPKLGPPIREAHIFALNDVYTRQSENLARKAYGVDYTRFGFDDFRPL